MGKQSLSCLPIVVSIRFYAVRPEICLSKRREVCVELYYSSIDTSEENFDLDLI